MKRQSLILITIDCLRADHVGFGGYARPTTPFLDCLAKESAVFEEAVVAGAPTYFSFPAILASRYPLALGRDIVGIAPQEPTLAQALKSAGYATAAFVAGNPYLSARFGYDHGFDDFEDFLEPTSTGEPPIESNSSEWNRVLQRWSKRTRVTSAAYDELYFWYCQLRHHQDVSMSDLRRYPSADVIVDRASSWLKESGDGPIFLWLHLMDPHHPYYPPEEAITLLLPRPISASRAEFLNAWWNRGEIAVARLHPYREEIVSLYDAGIRWADKQIERLVRMLKDAGRWDETALTVTADHGEQFLEHNARYHYPASLSEELIHVPLLIRAPGFTGARLADSPFSLVDLAPSLCDVVGVPPPANFQGRSRWAEIRSGRLADEPAIVECVAGCTNPFRHDARLGSRLLVVRDRSLKLVIDFDSHVERLYDLACDASEDACIAENALRADRVRLLQIARGHMARMTVDRERYGALARVRDLKQSLSS